MTSATSYAPITQAGVPSHASPNHSSASGSTAHMTPDSDLDSADDLVVRGRHGEGQSYKLKNMEKAPRDGRQGRFHDGDRDVDHTQDDDEDDDEDDDDEDEERYSRRSNRIGRRASDSTVQSFMLYTPEEERAVVRKFDRRLVLFLALLYMLSFLDRSNIGNARIAGLPQDLGLDSARYEWLLTAFYITYILFEWMTLLYRVVPAHIYISVCVLSWGVIASLQSLTTSFASLVVLRAALGIGEAAFGPGVPFYLSFFYKREELAFRTGLFISAAPLATSFASSLAWVIVRLGAKGPIAPWRLLFFVEGFPSVFVAIFAWGFIPDSPGKAKFLSERERRVAKLRLRKENPASSEDPENKGLKWREILQALTDPKCYLTAAMFFSCNVAFSSMPVFLPTIIHEMGYSALSSQALAAPPYLLSFLTVLITAFLSDRSRSRSSYTCFHAILASAGYTLVAIAGHYKWHLAWRYAGIYLATSGFFSAITIIITWTLNNQDSDSKKGTGMAILNIIGQCGPLLGTRLYPEKDAPYYIRGMTVCAAFMFLVFLLSVMLRVLLERENQRRDGVRKRGYEDLDGLVGKEMLAREQFKFIL